MGKKLSSRQLDEIRYWAIRSKEGLNLFGHIHAIEQELEEVVAKYGQAMSDIDRLTENVAQLQRELTEARNSQSEAIPLPRNIVNALNKCFAAGMSGFGIVSLTSVAGQLFRDYDRDVIKALDEIKSFSFHNSGEECEGPSGADLIIKALATSYTVEQTKEERLRDGVHELVMEWWATPAPSNHQENLANKVADFVTKFNTENG